jgi:hypothetical protein
VCCEAKRKESGREKKQRVTTTTRLPEQPIVLLVQADGVFKCNTCAGVVRELSGHVVDESEAVACERKAKSA